MMTETTEVVVGTDSFGSSEMEFTDVATPITVTPLTAVYRSNPNPNLYTVVVSGTPQAVHCGV